MNNIIPLSKRKKLLTFILLSGPLYLLGGIFLAILPVLFISAIFQLADGGVSSAGFSYALQFLNPNIFSFWFVSICSIIYSFILRKYFAATNLSREQIAYTSFFNGLSVLFIRVVFIVVILYLASPVAFTSATPQILLTYSVDSMVQFFGACISFSIPWLLIKPNNIKNI